MRSARSLGLALGLLLLAGSAAAQEATPAPAPAPAAPKPDSARPALQPAAELVFEREVFQYPTYQRRNPFRPLVGSGNGPRFEQVRLRGIIWSTDSKRSVALFAMGSATAAAAPDTTGVPTTKRLRVGESWGNMRVTEIQKDKVVVAVEEFGLSESKTLELTKRRVGGGQ